MSFVVIETQRLLRRGLPVRLMHARILRPSFTHPVKTHKPSFAKTVLTSTVTPLLLPTDYGPGGGARAGQSTWSLFCNNQGCNGTAVQQSGTALAMTFSSRLGGCGKILV